MTGWTRHQMAARAAEALRPGDYVNLGIGIPTLVADYVKPELGIILQSENGMLGVGPFPEAGCEDPDLINAGKQPVTEAAGSSYFSSAESFAMIRGGHIDVAVLGALQVSEAGDLANWAVPGNAIKGVGGAMDLVAGAGRVIVVMDHQDRHGQPKLKRSCTLPLTGERVVSFIVTDLASFSITAEFGMELVEIAPGIDLEDVRSTTEAIFAIRR